MNLDWKKEINLVVTLHRPNNVDNETQLKSILEAIIGSSHGIPVIFPVHPRTANTIKSIFHKTSLSSNHPFTPSPPLPFTPSLHLIEPLGYLEFNYLVQYAKAVITDSGGITEETTIMGVPCITLRDNTERPETVTMGTNELIGTNPEAIAPVLIKLFEGKWKEGKIPPLWDGNAAKRIINVLYKEF